MKTILDLIPTDIFALDLGVPEHDEYIKSGNCYEHYYELAKKYKPKSILEIGTRYGYSLCSMVAGSMDTVEYVEGWDDNSYHSNATKIAKINLKYILGYDKSWVIRIINSHEVKTLERNFDIVHIDGDHGYFGKLQDLNLVKNNCKVVIVDDYEYILEVHTATNEFLARNREIIKDWYIIDSFRGTFVIEFK
jgi:predicted O-methyltransferase YrrM